MKNILIGFMGSLFLFGCTQTLETLMTTETKSEGQVIPVILSNKGMAKKTDPRLKEGDDCIFKNGQCCRGMVCNSVFLNCVEGTSPVVTGCNESCMAQGVCEPKNKEEEFFLPNTILSKQEGGSRICCESFGFGAMMKKCCESYEWTSAEECKTPKAFVGGGKKIVENEFCKDISNE